jgi:hypothetical protein
VSMVRKILLYFEFAALMLIQIAVLASSVIALVPAFAQSGPKPAPNNTDIVQDFMATLPPSDNMPPSTVEQNFGHDQAELTAYRDETSTYYNSQISSHPEWVSASRFYASKKRDDKKLASRLAAAVAAFGQECAAKGGRVELAETAIFTQTRSRLHLLRSTDTLHICMRTPYQSLGAFASRASFVSWPIRSVWLTLRPVSVTTQAILDKEAADRVATENRRQVTRDNERSAVERWRRTIKAGTETSCGPVLRVNAEMVELVYYQTREPKWYRRSELWPERLNSDGLITCR